MKEYANLSIGGRERERERERETLLCDEKNLSTPLIEERHSPLCTDQRGILPSV